MCYLSGISRSVRQQPLAVRFDCTVYKMGLIEPSKVISIPLSIKFSMDPRSCVCLNERSLFYAHVTSLTQECYTVRVGETARATYLACATAADRILMRIAKARITTVACSWLTSLSSRRRRTSEIFFTFLIFGDSYGIRWVANRCVKIPVPLCSGNLCLQLVRQQEYGQSPRQMCNFLFSFCELLDPCFIYYICVAVGKRVCLNARENSLETELFSDIFLP